MRMAFLLEWKKKLLRYDLLFIDDEIKDIRDALAIFTTEEIEVFIGHLREACQNYWQFRNQKKTSDIWHAINDSLPIMKEARKQVALLKKLGNQGLPLGRMVSVPDLCNHSQDFEERNRDLLEHFTGGQSYFKLYSLAGHAETAINALVETLEEMQPEKPGRGSPKTEGDFAQVVADLFTKHFSQKPSKWREGALAKVLVVCLKGLGLPSEDIDRRLKTIRQK
jgi:hypothetical protein